MVWKGLRVWVANQLDVEVRWIEADGYILRCIKCRYMIVWYGRLAVRSVLVSGFPARFMLSPWIKWKKKKITSVWFVRMILKHSSF